MVGCNHDKIITETGTMIETGRWGNDNSHISSICRDLAGGCCHRFGQAPGHKDKSALMMEEFNKLPRKLEAHGRGRVTGNSHGT